MERRIKTPAESECFIAEIVGEESLMGQRMSAGRLLHMMDMAAASAAARHAESTIVTLAFDRIELLDFIYHMDYVRYDAYVIQVGRSSMVVKVDGYSKAPDEMNGRSGHGGVITMVAVDQQRRPNRNIPGLEYVTPADLERKALAESRQRLLENRRRMIAAVDGMDTQALERPADVFERNTRVSPLETELVIRKKFLPRNANALGNVFGGDTVEMMEELALAAARQFTGNFRMVTIAMEDVLFLKPLLLDDIVEMRARVIFVANTTLVVEITVKGEDFFDAGKSHMTNKGLFTVLNYDRSGRKKSIPTGLELSGADPDTRRAYLKELIKYEKRTGYRSKNG
ncbi:MAG: hotdog domain-containing protein [Thermodesulfobacteriota bacterium]